MKFWPQHYLQKLIFSILIFETIFGIRFVQAASSPGGCETDTMKDGVQCSYADLRSWSAGNTNICAIEKTCTETTSTTDNVDCDTPLNFSVCECKDGYFNCSTSGDCIYRTVINNCAGYNSCTGYCTSCSTGFTISNGGTASAQCLGAQVRLGASSVSGTDLRQGNASSFVYINDNGMSINTSTIPMSTSLYVIGASEFSSPLFVGAPSADNHAATKSYVDSLAATAAGAYWAQSGSNLYASSTSWNIGIGTTDPGTAKLAVMGGNVGIGTTSPNVKLNVVDGTPAGTYTGLYTGMVFDGSNVGEYLHIKTTDGGSLSSGIILGSGNKNWYINAKGPTSNNNFDLGYRAETADGFTPGGSTLFSLTTSGNVGIGTTSPGARLDVNGLIKMRGTQISQPEDVINQGYLNSALSAFNSNTNLWKLSSNKIYASSTDWNIGIGTNDPGTAKLAVMGGNVGVGTSNPGNPFVVVGGRDTVVIGTTTASLPARFSNTNFKGLIIQGSTVVRGGVLSVKNVDSTLEGFFAAHNAGIEIGAHTASPLLFLSNAEEKMRLTSAGNLGIGTTSPSYKLDVNGGARFTGTVKVATPSAANDAVTKSYLDSALINSTSSNAYLLKAGDSMSGDLDMDGHKIVGVNKLTVTTIDPLYDIDGVKYSTYAPSVVGGVKEEYIGRGEIRQCGKDYCSWRLDFSSQEKGSDLWVWRQIIDFQPENVDVLMTAYGRPASLSYEIEDNQIIFYADRPTRFSYRLVGSRFDWRKWPTLAVDQSEEAGLIIK